MLKTPPTQASEDSRRNYHRETFQIFRKFPTFWSSVLSISTGVNPYRNVNPHRSRSQIFPGNFSRRQLNKSADLSIKLTVKQTKIESHIILEKNFRLLFTPNQKFDDNFQDDELADCRNSQHPGSRMDCRMLVPDDQGRFEFDYEHQPIGIS